MSMNRSRLSLCLLLGVLGCAHKAPVASTTPAAETTMTVLPPDGEEFPDVLRALGAAISNLDVPGVTKKVHSKVTLEVVQLAIECIEPTAECYTAVSQSLGADLLLFSTFEQTDDGFDLSATLFDAGNGRTRKHVARSFASAEEATEGIEALVQGLVNSRTETARR